MWLTAQRLEQFFEGEQGRPRQADNLFAIIDGVDRIHAAGVDQNDIAVVTALWR